jgi:hypothetical protein
MVNNTANLYLGCYAGVSGYFVGELDEVRLFGKVLSEAERTNVYTKVAGW